MGRGYPPSPFRPTRSLQTRPILVISTHLEHQLSFFPRSVTKSHKRSQKVTRTPFAVSSSFPFVRFPGLELRGTIFFPRFRSQNVPKCPKRFFPHKNLNKPQHHQVLFLHDGAFWCLLVPFGAFWCLLVPNSVTDQPSDFFPPIPLTNLNKS